MFGEPSSSIRAHGHSWSLSGIRSLRMALMAHIEDRWKRADRQTGRRWRVRYLDPAGRERNRSFDRKVDAERFRVQIEADVQRGTYIDPAGGKLTLRRYAEQWLSAQTYTESTRQHTESRVRRHLYPVLGDRQ